MDLEKGFQAEERVEERVVEGKFVPLVVRYASRGQFEKMVNALEELGESVNSTDCNQHGALFYAALYGHKKCLKELLKRGADPNQADGEGLTPCHAVALSGIAPRGTQDDHHRITSGDPSSDQGCCMEGLCTIMTKIHSSHCQRRCLQYLVQYGGDLKKCTYQNQETTRDIAVRRGKTAVVTVIDEYYTLQADNNESAELLFPPSQSTPWMHSTPPVHVLKKQNAMDSIPELQPGDVERVPVYSEYQGVDGSIWSKGVWADGIQVTLRQMAKRGRERKTSEGVVVMCAEHLLREMDNLRAMRHPHFALLMAVCMGPCQQDMFVAMEPLQNGSLYSMLHKDHRKFSQSEAVTILSDITSAVAYLHNIQRVAHNILSSHAVYLAPKGGAKLCNVFCCQPPSCQLPGLCSSALKLFLSWMAPELMQTRIAAFESDIFSLGVMLWELWSGTPPWPGLSPPQLGRAMIQNGQRLPLTNQHMLIAPILKTCFGAPGARLPAAQLLSQINYIKMTRFYHA